MSLRIKLLAASALAGAFAIALATTSQAARTDSTAAFSTPAGITVAPPETQRGGRRGPSRYTPGVISDEKEMTLYTYEPDADAGKPTCVDACAKEWPPMLAPVRAIASGDWTTVARPDGAKQWAYKGKPLYRSVKDTKPGESNGSGADSKWQVAAYEILGPGAAAPAGISVKPNTRAQADVFTDFRGMTLYVFDLDKDGKSICKDDCARAWPPLVAGELSKPMGDWAITERADGTRQWTYKNRPVYTFTGDERPGDANGELFDERWHAAALRQYFAPATVELRKSGSIISFTTTSGMTLYARDRYQYAPGSFHANDGSTSNIAYGREIGTQACDGACPVEWVPYTAAADAQPSGYWAILTREDGTRQWAYQGYALYTNTKDKKPGDMFGRDVFDFTDGSHARFWRIATP